ncbi:MAG: prepilin-type N-terminal cleavage/methylation domain-containing protein [Christensenellales bacterium]|jgi:type IV pilus assembly protein PilA
MLQMLIQKKQSKKAFTLVELIIVIAILAILAAILVPTLTKYINESKQATNNANARAVFSIAQAEATFKITKNETGFTGADILNAIQGELGALAEDATITITVANDAVTAVSYASGGITGNYPVVDGD